MPNNSGYYSYTDFFRGQIDPNYQGQPGSFGGGIPTRINLPSPDEMDPKRFMQTDPFFPEGVPQAQSVDQMTQEQPQ